MARTTSGSRKNRLPDPPRTYFDGAQREPVGCRFILDDNGHGCRSKTWRFCQRPVKTGRSFCVDHEKIVFQPDRPKDERLDEEWTRRQAIARLREHF